MSIRIQDYKNTYSTIAKYVLDKTNGYVDIPMIRVLIESETKKSCDESACIGILLGVACEVGNLNVVKYLIMQDADSVHYRHDMAIVYAGQNGHLPIVKCLINAGALVSTRDNSALERAAGNGYLGVVKCLLELDTKVGNNIIYAVFDGGHVDILKYFVEENYLTFPEIGSIFSPFISQHMFNAGFLDMIEYLFDLHSDSMLERGFLSAVAKGNLEIVEMFKHRDVKLETSTYQHSIKRATEHKNTQMTKCLFSMNEHANDSSMLSKINFKMRNDQDLICYLTSCIDRVSIIPTHLPVLKSSVMDKIEKYRCNVDQYLLPEITNIVIDYL